MNPLSSPAVDVLVSLGIAHLSVAAAMWYGRLVSRPAASPRQDRWLSLSLLSVTVSSLTYVGYWGVFIYRRIYVNRLYRADNAWPVLLGLLTAGFAFFCTMVGDKQSRQERIRVFASAVAGGLLWLVLVVVTGFSAAFQAGFAGGWPREPHDRIISFVGVFRGCGGDIACERSSRFRFSSIPKDCCALTVTNGDGKGNQQATSYAVYVDGKQVVAQSSAEHTEATVSIPPQGAIRVMLTGNTDSRIVVRLTNHPN